MAALPPDLLAKWPIWLAVTLLLGGPAAFAAGRAVAMSWRPFPIAIAYAAMLALVADFLCYALFEIAVIPAISIISSALARDTGGVLALLSGWAATFVLLLAVIFAGWRLTRAEQMRRQYPFLYPSSGP